MRWPLILFLWFCAEVLVLVQVGIWIGAPETLALLLLSMAIGATFLRAEGVLFVARMAGIVRNHAESLADGRPDSISVRPLAESAPRFLAGLLFLVPGFLSDLAAILILLPPVRRRIVRRVEAFMVESRHAANARRGFTSLDIDAEMADDLDEGEDEDEDEREHHPRIGRRIP